MSVEVVTLGCRLNIAESDAIAAMLSDADDTVVINSCAVTTEAARHTRQAIRRARRRRPEARLIVTGCAVGIEGAQLADMPEIDAVVANADKFEAAAYRDEREGQPFDQLGASGVSNGNDYSARAELVEAPPLGQHTRAFVPIQTGCDHACTFCAIPQGRGPSRSRAVTEVVAEVARQVAGGAREAVLTGVDVTAWGLDLPGGQRLGNLVAAILAGCPTLARLRLSSLDGVEIDATLFELLAREARVMPHLHLSLQSGDDLTLKRMKRRHSRGDAVRLVERLRARRPDIAIGADLIAGFPTETEAMHRNNLSIVHELGIVHGHVFPYSPRPGTPAARMPQVAPALIRERAAELRQAAASERRRWLEGLVGQPLRVLAERDGTGHAENFAPVRLPAGSAAGTIIELTPTTIEQGMLA